MNIAKQTGGDPDLNVSATSLIFTSGNWNIPRPVSVSAAQDTDTINGTAVFTVSSAGVLSRTVTATERDDDFEAHYDFGTSGSPVNAGYNPVSEGTNFTTARGYGWLSGTISSRDRGTGSALERDLNFTPDGTFVVNVPNATYNVTVRLGDRGQFWHDQMGVYLEGTQVGTVSTGRAEVVNLSYEVAVNDGQLTLRLRDQGGTDPNASIVGLDIVTVVPPVPTLSITDVSMTEGDSGTKNFNFTVQLSQPSGQNVTVDYATANGTATAAADYTATSGTLTVIAGATTGTITVSVTGDTAVESAETFYVNLSNPQNALLGDNQGVGTITSDDVTPTLSVVVSSSTFGENAGNSAAIGTVSRTGPTTAAVTVNLTSSDTSEANVPSTVTILAGQSSATFAVSAVNDTVVDGTQSGDDRGRRDRL